MRPAPLALAALLLLPVAAAPLSALASDVDARQFSCDPPTRWASRHDPREARIAITTAGGEAQMVLTDRVVAVQLSERALREIRRETRKEMNEEEDNPIARAIKVAVLTGVRALLSHSAECPLREISDVEYRNGRLVMTSEDGERLFGNVRIDDEELLESFTEADARAFVREFRRAKARL